MSTLVLRPMTLKAARRFVDEHHRHHRAPQGGLFAIGADEFSNDGMQLAAVAIVGRPIARAYDDLITAEVTRLCALEGHPNACSFLYAACWRAARAMGYVRLITYTLASEPGTTLKAAGWRVIHQTQDRPRGWNTPSRPREITGPTEAKTLWIVA